MVHHKWRRVRRFLKSSSVIVSGAAVLVGTVAPALPAHANWAGADKSIIYQKTLESPTGSTYEYHVVMPDGSNDRKLNLTFPAGISTVSALHFTNDGSHFVFLGKKNGNYNIYFAEASNGKNARQLTDSNAYKDSLMLTSNGLWVLWIDTDHDTGVSQIKRVSTAGGAHLPVTITFPTGFTSIDQAHLSGDDQTIAFSSRDANNSNNADILSVPAAGGAAVNITNTPSNGEYVYDWGRTSSKIFIYNGQYGLINPDGSSFLPISTADFAAAGIQPTDYITLSPSTDERVLVYSRVLATPQTYKIHVIGGTTISEVPYLFFDGTGGVYGQVLGWSSVDLSGLSTPSTSKLPNTGVAQHMQSSIGLYGAILAAAGIVGFASKRRIFRPKFAQR